VQKPNIIVKPSSIIMFKRRLTLRGRGSVSVVSMANAREAADFLVVTISTEACLNDHSTVLELILTRYHHCSEQTDKVQFKKYIILKIELKERSLSSETFTQTLNIFNSLNAVQ